MEHKKEIVVTGVLAHVMRFFKDIFKSVAESLLVVVGTFVFATTVSAGMLWFYDWPLFLAPVGGFIVLGVMLVLWYDS
jgi:ABC-type bacteriocin/lantibiotic exporter with double-glycine peptidase domain